MAHKSKTRISGGVQPMNSLGTKNKASPNISSAKTESLYRNSSLSGSMESHFGSRRENKIEISQRSPGRLLTINPLRTTGRSTSLYSNNHETIKIESASSSKYGTFDLESYTSDLKELSNSIPSIDSGKTRTFTKSVIGNSKIGYVYDEKNKGFSNGISSVTSSASSSHSINKYRPTSSTIADKFLNKNLKSLSKNQKKKSKGSRIDRPINPHDFYSSTKRCATNTPVDGRLISLGSKPSTHKRMRKEVTLDLEDEGQYRLGKHVDSFKRLDYEFDNGSIMTLTASDYSCLYDNQWINDTVIDFFLKYIVQNNRVGIKKEHIYVMTTYFFSKLVSIVPKKFKEKKSQHVSGTNGTVSEIHEEEKNEGIKCTHFDDHSIQNESSDKEADADGKIDINITNASDDKIRNTGDSMVSNNNDHKLEKMKEELYPYYYNMKRWLAKSRLHEYDYIVMPINESLHWYCAVIYNFSTLLTNVKECKNITITPLDDDISEENVTLCTIYYFDSLSQKHENIKDPIINCLIGYAKDILDIDLDEDMFQLKRAVVPKQNNFNDCGIHVIYNIEKFIQQPKECLSFWMKYNTPNRKTTRNLSTVFSKEERDKYRKYLRVVLQKLETEYSKKFDDTVKNIDYSDDEIEIVDIPNTTS